MCELQALLRSLTYSYLSNNLEPLPGERVITIAVADGRFPSVNLDLFIEVSIINNNPPVLQFAGPATVTYTENIGSPVQLPVGSIMQPRIVDLDNNNVFLMEQASVVLVNALDGASESLSVSGAVANISTQG